MFEKLRKLDKRATPHLSKKRHNQVNNTQNPHKKKSALSNSGGSSISRFRKDDH